MKKRLSIFSLFTIASILLISPANLLAGPVSLEPSEVLKLRVIIRTNAIAAAEFAKLREVADRALDDEPDPIEKVISEGHLANDPLKIRSGAATKDINKTDCLGWTWAVTGDERYAAKVRDYILAWAKVNKADGDAMRLNLNR
jgi:hypothetical protein